jgi:hypothetical protein
LAGYWSLICSRAFFRQQRGLSATQWLRPSAKLLCTESLTFRQSFSAHPNLATTMTQERQIVTDFNLATQGYWTTHSDYDEVNALLIYWVDDDLDVALEVTRLQTLFENDFSFKASIYLIPTENCEIELQYELTSFLRQHSISRRSLTIVYYAGHADPPDKNEPGYSKWRA